MRRIIVFGFLSCVACSGGGDDDEFASVSEPIIGGVEAPNRMSVGFVVGDSLDCTGFIVSPNVVLTAAHCFGSTFEHPSPNPPRAYYMGAGSPWSGADSPREWQVDRLPGFSKRPIASWGVHPSAQLRSGPYRNDLAYIVLQHPVVAAYLPIRAQGALPAPNTVCFAFGYGLSAHGSPTGGVKKRGALWISSATESVISTRYGNATPYFGDSGGPLVCNDTAYGVFSWITNTSNPVAGASLYDPIDVGWVQGIIDAHRP